MSPLNPLAAYTKVVVFLCSAMVMIRFNNPLTCIAIGLNVVLNRMDIDLSAPFLCAPVLSYAVMANFCPQLITSWLHRSQDLVA
ncbi:uncharacterized protein BCR38DRAFT_491108 [Pseudomassariella vexata]|uniref:Uncharacterized protein n=1 Tax=Pseudomassariella vexata TaxID=1141098 RepID=A0A1Y2D894_9PEZI|nr:uncharacterized protein BCR38DRAFT_491108 [Pseudomassariella vexata]ORY55481.1 hypothetical protein BCR38DRAFT_491108 [Pseudomassariella vexata]